MRSFAFHICAIFLFVKSAYGVRLPARPKLPTSVRVFKPVQLKTEVLYKGSKVRDGIQCPSATLIHEDIQPVPIRTDVFWIPHSLIIHNGLRCGTGRRSEYMLVVNGRDIAKKSVAKERGLEEVYEELRTNGRGISSFIALNAIDPVHVGIEMSAHRQCGGRVIYPRGSVFLFISPSLTNINLGFAYFPKFSVGMLSVLNNQNLCAYVNGKPRFSDAKPSTLPSSSVSPPPKNPYELSFPSLELRPTSSSGPPPLTPSNSRKPRPSATPKPQKTIVSPAASKKPIPSGNPAISSKPSTSPSKNQSPGLSATKSPVPSASRSPTSGASRSGKACFPNSATVEIESGHIVPISALHIGDRVRTGPTSFSRVFMFTHKDSIGLNEFLRIETVSGAFIELSAGHYILVNGVLTAARNLRTGDVVSLASGVDDIVVGVRTVWMNGLHNPQTIDGNIVVDGIIASTYTEAIIPPVATALLAPFRAMCYFGIWEAPLKNVFYLSDRGALSCLPKSFSSPLESHG